MSISETLYCYNIGQLVFMPLRKLKIALQVLDNKIDYMQKVAKQGSVAAEVYADIRKYEEVQKSLTEIIETKEVEESEMLCGMLKSCPSVKIDPSQNVLGTGKIQIDIEHGGRPGDFPADYSII